MFAQNFKVTFGSELKKKFKYSMKSMNLTQIIFYTHIYV